MSKTLSCIKLLRILYTRNRVSVDELARRLETNPRNIREYRKELEYAGFPIDFKTGKNGGYALNRNQILPALKLSLQEETTLQTGFDFLSAHNDFLDENTLNSAISKIFSSIEGKSPTREETKIFVTPRLNMPKKDLQNRYYALNNCLLNKTKIYVTYRDDDNTTREHKIHPYKLFFNEFAWFVLAYSELNKDMKIFKLARITSFKETFDHFRKKLDYNEKDYLNIQKNSADWFDYTLEFTGPAALTCQDLLFGKDQKITQINKTTTRIFAKSNSIHNLINLILPFGSSCKIISPKSLITAYQTTLQNILKIYE